MNVMGANSAVGPDNASANAIGQAISAHVLNGDPLPFVPNNAMNGKKAVHVKWAGKTIALGTFAIADADEKCARAKALTRAWRSTMRPKPSREWVMLELERLQIRAVTGKNANPGGGGQGKDTGSAGGGSDDGGSVDNKAGMMGMGIGMGMGMSGGNGTMMQGGGLDLMQGGGGGGNMIHKLNGMNGGGGSMNGNGPQHGPLGGGGGGSSSGAYEAGCGDSYANNNSNGNNNAMGPIGVGVGVKDNNNNNGMGAGGMGMGGGQVRRRLSGIQNSLGGGMGMNGMNSMGGGGNDTMPNMGANPSQHYEMLKLHHMNLLNEIQETTLMMNLYQQQMMQQQQGGGGDMGNEGGMRAGMGMGGMGGGGMGMGMAGNNGMGGGMGMGMGVAGNGMGGGMGGGNMGMGGGMGNEGMSDGMGMGGGFGNNGTGGNMGGGLGNGMGEGSNGGLGPGMDNFMQQNNGSMNDDSFTGNNQMDPLSHQQGMMQGGGMGGLGGEDTFDMTQGGPQRRNSDMAKMLQGFREQCEERPAPNTPNEQSLMLQDDRDGSTSSTANARTGSTSGQREINPKQEPALAGGLDVPRINGTSTPNDSHDLDPQERLRRLKEEIAQREREAKELLSAVSEGSGMKHKRDGGDESGDGTKRVKSEAE